MRVWRNRVNIEASRDLGLRRKFNLLHVETVKKENTGQKKDMIRVNQNKTSIISSRKKIFKSGLTKERTKRIKRGEAYRNMNKR